MTKAPFLRIFPREAGSQGDMALTLLGQDRRIEPGTGADSRLLGGERVHKKGAAGRA